MSNLFGFAIRWLSYPAVLGSAAGGMIWLLYDGAPYWPTTLFIAAMAILAVAILERLKPFRESWLEDHQDTRTDFIHLLVNLSIIQFAAVVLARIGDWVPDSARIFPTDLPLWCQLVFAALILDLSFYSMHRLSHRVSWLWRLHAPHHSSERLYWMNGERRHPVHAAIMAGPGLLVLFAAGAPSSVVATWFGILTVHLAFQHANLDYSLGWLRQLIAVAETHRWHHKREFEDAQVNFGEFLLLWDHLFGTFFDDAGRLGNTDVGLREQDYPKGYWAQLLAPFRSG